MTSTLRAHHFLAAAALLPGCGRAWGDGTSEEGPCDPGSPATQAHGYSESGVYDVRVRVFSAPDRFGEAVTRVTVTAP